MNIKDAALGSGKILILSLMLALPATAFAYVGPGAGLSIIGSLLAFLAAIVVGIFGFLWFPIRRLIRKRKLAAAARAAEATSEPEPPVDTTVDAAEGYQTGSGEPEP